MKASEPVRVRSWAGYYELGLMINPSIDRMGLDVHEFRLFAHLCSQAGLTREDFLLSAEKIAEICCMDEAEVRAAYKGLLDKGLVRPGQVRDEFGIDTQVLFVGNAEIGLL